MQSLLLAVLIGCQPYGFRFLGFGFQLFYNLFLISRNFIMRFEIFININTELFFLQSRICRNWKDFIVLSEEFLDSLSFCRRLDNDKVFLA